MIDDVRISDYSLKCDYCRQKLGNCNCSKEILEPILNEIETKTDNYNLKAPLEMRQHLKRITIHYLLYNKSLKPVTSDLSLFFYWQARARIPYDFTNIRKIIFDMK